MARLMAGSVKQWLVATIRCSQMLFACSTAFYFDVHVKGMSEDIAGRRYELINSDREERDLHRLEYLMAE